MRPSRMGTLDLNVGNTNVTGTMTQFVAGDVGKNITIRTNQGDFQSVITNVTTATVIDLTIAPTVTQSGCFYYLDWVPVDVYQDVPVSLNYSMADIRDPEKRSTDWSRTVTIPGSKANNELLGYIFEIGIDGAFNPNIKSQVYYVCDGMVQFEGIAQLVKIRKERNGKIEYDLNLFGRLGNIYYNLKDTRLTDLDLSEFDHALTTTNITESWATQIQKNGGGYNNFNGGVAGHFPNGTPNGEGYVYPLIDYGYGTDLANFNVEWFRPAIYVKQLLDKIFAYAGFTYSSAFFDSDLFKQFIIPFNNGVFRLSSDQVNARRWEAGMTTLQSLTTSVGLGTASATIQFDDVTNAPFFDNTGGFNVGTYMWTCNATGRYNFLAHFPFNIVGYPAHNGVYYDKDIFMQIQVLKNGAWIGSVNYGATNISGGPVNNGDTLLTASVDLNAQGISCVAGDQITFNLFCATTAQNMPGGVNFNSAADGSGTQYAGDIDIEVDAAYSLDEVINDGLVEGDTVSLNTSLPYNIYCKDFLTSVIKMFNLMVQPDADVSNKLIIEPWPSYFTTDHVDWTPKLDLNTPLEILPMGELQAKAYHLHYQKDTDYFNQKYINAHNEVYGRRLIDVDNDFNREIREIAPIFASTPSVGSQTNDRVIPRILFVDQNLQVSMKESVIRFIRHNGLFDCDQWNINDSGGANAETQYPMTGHIDDPANVQYDLCFGYPREVYWNGIFTYSNNNLYNLYHRQMIEEIINKDAKVVIGLFDLRPLDILQLNFRTLVFVDGFYYRLSKITDYQPGQQRLTKVELIKVKDGVTFTATDSVINGGVLPMVDSERPPVNPIKWLGNANMASDQMYVSGSANNIDPTVLFGAVIGSNNAVGKNANKIFIKGNGNKVFAGLENVTILNTDNYEATESNICVVNGRLIDSTIGTWGYITGSIADQADLQAEFALYQTKGYSQSFLLMGG